MDGRADGHTDRYMDGYHHAGNITLPAQIRPSQTPLPPRQLMTSTTTQLNSITHSLPLELCLKTVTKISLSVCHLQLLALLCDITAVSTLNLFYFTIPCR